MNFLKCHPFPVRAQFDRVVAVSFAFPEEVLQSLVPQELEIDTYEGLGFVTVALVWTRGLRPAGFPEFLGQNFFLCGYRIFTRLRDSDGRRLRGLTILRSDTDKRRMVWLGNLMTGYRYRHVRAQIEVHASGTTATTTLPDGTPALELSFDDAVDRPGLPEGSPFSDWPTARRFAGPMPFTFSPSQKRTFVVIEGSRTNWTPRPIVVKKWKVALFDESPLKGVIPVLANAFAVEKIDYRWEKGRIVQAGNVL
jgi:hypothetical protein